MYYIAINNAYSDNLFFKNSFPDTLINSATLAYRQSDISAKGDVLYHDQQRLTDSLTRVSNFRESCAFILNKDYTNLFSKAAKNSEAEQRFLTQRYELEEFDLSGIESFMAEKETLVSLSPGSPEYQIKREQLRALSRQAEAFSALVHDMSISLNEIKNEVKPRVRDFLILTAMSILMQLASVIISVLIGGALILVSPLFILCYPYAFSVSSTLLNTYRVIANKLDSNKIDEWSELEKHFSMLGGHITEVKECMMLKLYDNIYEKIEKIETQSKQYNDAQNKIFEKLNAIDATVNRKQDYSMGEISKINNTPNKELARQVEDRFAQVEAKLLEKNQQIEKLTHLVVDMAAKLQRQQNNASSSVAPSNTLPRRTSLPDLKYLHLA